MPRATVAASSSQNSSWMRGSSARVRVRVIAREGKGKGGMAGFWVGVGWMDMDKI
jgi:hypothetical protein